MTLLICEDENIIRKGFIITLQKLNFLFDSVFEASDGLQGMEICRQYKPDIIITDIQMPLMDGLSFISRAKEFCPNSHFIILSGYDNFEYARTAMRYGVKDYLLKPSSKEEISEVLSQVITDIEQEQAFRSELHSKQYTFERTLSQFQKIFLGDVLLGKYSPQHIDDYMASYNIHLGSDFLLVVCFKVIYPEDRKQDTSIDLTHTEWFRHLLEKYFCLSQAEISSDMQALILNNTRPVFELQKIDANISQQIKNYEAQHNIRFYCAFSRTTDNIRELPVLYREALALLYYRFFYPETIFFAQNTVPCCNEKRNIIIPDAMLDSLFHAFTGKSRLDFRQNVYALLEYFYSSPNICPDSFALCVEKACHHLTVSLIRGNYISKVQDSLSPNVSSIFERAYNVQSLTKLLYHQLADYRKSIIENRKSDLEKPRSPIETAIAYIDANYHKDLDLSSVAELAAMNSSYFSSQFKKRTGLPFSSYVQKLRLEKAKDLLINSNQKLYEISESIGISNVKYFCKIFKEYTGMTPTEYKKQHLS